MRERDQVERRRNEGNRRERHAERNVERRCGYGCVRQNRAGTKEILRQRDHLIAALREIFDDDADARCAALLDMLARPIERSRELIAPTRRGDARRRRMRYNVRRLDAAYFRTGADEGRTQALLLRCQLDEPRHDQRVRAAIDASGNRRQLFRRLREIACVGASQRGSVLLRPTHEDRNIVGLFEHATPGAPAFSARAPGMDQRPRVSGESRGAVRIEQRQAIGVDNAPPQERGLRGSQQE